MFCMAESFTWESLFYQITTRNATKSYMKMVDNSYFGSSDEVQIFSFSIRLIGH